MPADFFDDAGVQKVAQAGPDRVKLGRSTRDWTLEDELTHDFTDCEEFRELCLAKYGQYVTVDGIRVTAPAVGA